MSVVAKRLNGSYATWYEGKPRPVSVYMCYTYNFWATVCKTVRRRAYALRPLSLCPVLFVLTVTLVYCGQTVGWIKVKLGMQVGLGPGHIVLDGDPAPLPQRGTAPIFGPYRLWPNGWMD